MDEREALALLGEELAPAGDDAAVVDGLVLTTDMLHETTDFPPGTTRYTAGWRTVAASLSDVAAMGAVPTAAVAVYAAPSFEADELLGFVRGAADVCASVGARYVGGDLDHHDEFTAVSTVVGRTDAAGATGRAVTRSGAQPGDLVGVSGALGRTAAAIALFESGENDLGGSGSSDRASDAIDRANDLFRFSPRVETGLALAPHATAMMDSSDGLARSLHQLAEASGCGFAIEGDRIPIADALTAVGANGHDGTNLPAGGESLLETAITFGEDFELVFTIPEAKLEAARAAAPIELSIVGRVTDDGVTLDGAPLADTGYDHG